MKDKSFSITDKETIAEYKEKVRRLEVEVSVLRQQKTEAWTTTGLMSEQKRNDLLRDENERLRSVLDDLLHVAISKPMTLEEQADAITKARQALADRP